MQTTNEYALLLFIKRGEDHQAWKVVPAANGINLIAVNEEGQMRRFAWVDNDFMLDLERFSIVQGLPDKEFIAVPVRE